jgi:hypothetical protein
MWRTAIWYYFSISYYSRKIRRYEENHTHQPAAYPWLLLILTIAGMAGIRKGHLKIPLKISDPTIDHSDWNILSLYISEKG